MLVPSRPTTREPDLQIGPANTVCMDEALGGKRRETPIEGIFIRCSRPFVFHRYPQVHCETFRCQERICAITSLIASGAKPCAPNDPSPPKLETAAVSLYDDSPPSGL